MGLGQSAMLYESVRRGDIDSIRLHFRSGAKLNWLSSSGKTPLVLACSRSYLLQAAVELIDLGADVNYCDPESQRWTALGMAAKQGLLQTVNLLLLHGANPLLCGSLHRNALEIAREKGFIQIVYAIENKICFFSGWLRKFQASVGDEWEKTWVVVLPGGYSLSMDKRLLKIAIYNHQHQAVPSKIMSLRDYTLWEPDFSHHDPELVLVGKSMFSSGIPIKLRAGKPGDSEQMKLFHMACTGVIRGNHHSGEATLPAGDGTSTSHEDSDIAAAIAASIQTALDDGIPLSAIGFNGQAETSSSHSLPMASTVMMNGSSASPVSSSLPSSSSSSSSSCVICTESNADTVCVPCGHLAGCMTCLKEVEKKKIGCPVCRAPIERIMKIYFV